jgi:hypothetical protein
MRIEVNMTIEEQKLAICSWWASSPAFALETLRSQLEAARILWPEELGDIIIGTTTPQPETKPQE